VSGRQNLEVFLSPINALLTRVVGGERRALVILNAAVAWLICTLAVVQATQWPALAIMPFTLVFGLLVGAITRGVASGPIRGLRAIVGRGLVAAALGMVVGEFAALAVFSGSIDRQLELQAARSADSAPAVVQASASLSQLRNTRVSLDKAVDTARIRRDETGGGTLRIPSKPGLPTNPYHRGARFWARNPNGQRASRRFTTGIGHRDRRSRPPSRRAEQENRRRRAGSYSSAAIRDRQR
jgi:hypothetical protein